MTAVTQAIAILEGIAGKTIAPTALKGYAENYLRRHQNMPPTPFDMSTLTNEELAQKFVDKLGEGVRAEIRLGAALLAEETNQAVVDAAADAAVADLA